MFFQGWNWNLKSWAAHSIFPNCGALVTSYSLAAVIHSKSDTKWLSYRHPPPLRLYSILPTGVPPLFGELYDSGGWRDTYEICQHLLALASSRTKTRVCMDGVRGISLDLLQEETELPVPEAWHWGTGARSIGVPLQLLSELRHETQRPKLTVTHPLVFSADMSSSAESKFTGVFKPLSFGTGHGRHFLIWSLTRQTIELKLPT